MRSNAGNPADLAADSDGDHSFEMGHITISQMSPSVKEGALMTSERMHFTLIFARLMVIPGSTSGLNLQLSHFCFRQIQASGLGPSLLT